MTLTVGSVGTVAFGFIIMMLHVKVGSCINVFSDEHAITHSGEGPL